MKTIREVLEAANPKKGKDEYWYCSASYEDAFHDCEKLVWKEVGSYQGDIFALVKDPEGRYGFVVIGYGSCSGCDALADAESHCSDEKQDVGPVVSVLECVRNETHWEPTKEAMHKYLSEECDRVMKETYLDEEEKKTVWPELLKAVS